MKRNTPSTIYVVVTAAIGLTAIIGVIAIPCAVVYTIVHFVIKFW